jgi:hypothetical protein
MIQYKTVYADTVNWIADTDHVSHTHTHRFCNEKMKTLLNVILKNNFETTHHTKITFLLKNVGNYFIILT